MANDITLNTPPSKSRVQWFFTFFRAQLSAFTSGIFDYLIMISLTEYFGLAYTKSIIVSGICGAVMNYSINRYWSFKATNKPASGQLAKFVFVVMGSITIKDVGTYLLTRFVRIDYKIGKLLMDAITSLGFNFVLQKYWVFKK